MAKKFSIIGQTRLLTAQEKDARNYFEGTGFSADYQESTVRPNIFDTLLKMQNQKLRRNFLNSSKNREYFTNEISLVKYFWTFGNCFLTISRN